MRFGAPDEKRRDVGGHPVHEACGKERRGRHSPAFDQQGPHLERMKGSEKSRQIHAACASTRRGHGEDLNAPLEECRETRIAGRDSRHEPDLAAGRGEHPSRGGHAEGAVEDEPPMRRDRRREGQAAGQKRIVREDRAGTDEDRVTLLAQKEGVVPGRFARDPLRLSGPRRDAPVERRGPLDVDEGTPVPDRLQEGLIQSFRLVRERADQHLDTVPPQAANAAPCGPRVRILGGAHDARYASRDESLRAGVGAPKMGAGLEVDEQRRPLRTRSRGCEGDRFRVRAAGALVRPLPDHFAGRVHEDGPDARVRRGRETPPAGELEDPPPEDVERGAFSHRRALRRRLPHRSPEDRPRSPPRPRSEPAARVRARWPGSRRPWPFHPSS